MDGLEVAKRRFGDSDAGELGRKGAMMLAKWRETGVYPDFSNSLACRTPVHTNADRLAYYRAHGLDRCDDYPGGDAAFEADVLSGEYHDRGPSLEPLKREDAYVISKMSDGSFRYDGTFLEYGHRPEVRLAYMKNAGRNGFRVHLNYAYGSFDQFEADVLSGRYARRILTGEDR